ncbi:phosphotransferase [Streptomyces echinatus]|uniref:phosphotransferase n=1 Tax=Streptomyces echinatus TaxID=67293 RepID=UPI0037FB8D73
MRELTTAGTPTSRTARERHREPLDVHLILRRETAGGPEVLMTRRVGAVYAAGLWHLPSGHLDGPHEDVVTALLREAREETGVVIDPADVRAAVTVHHRGPGGRSRTGYFFEVRRWRGDPRIAEPEVCDAMDWVRLDTLPAGTVAYCRAGLDAYTSGARLAVHFQRPRDEIAYDPATDRLRIVPGADGDPPSPVPEPAVREFAERAVGRISRWTDVGWARAGSRVWRARGTHGGTWYVKVHQNDRFHAREVRAYRTWALSLGSAAPRLVAPDDRLRAVVVTAVPGRPLYGAVLSPAEGRTVFRTLGALARRIHDSAPARPAPTATDPAAAGPVETRADRRLAAARPHLRPGDEEFVRELLERATTLPPPEWVETHGDFQLRNLLRADDGSVAVIDFERSEPGPATRDLVRLDDAWTGRPDLSEAFFDGYGRQPTEAEAERLTADSALDAVSGIGFGTAHGDPELVERGRRTLARLRAAAGGPWPWRPGGGR